MRSFAAITLLALAATAVYPVSPIFAAGAEDPAASPTTLPNTSAAPTIEPPGLPVAPPLPETPSVLAAPPSATTRPSPEARVSMNEVGDVEIHVTEASIVDVLKLLSVHCQKNIVVTKDVQGTVTANLYAVTLHETLDAILHTNGFDYRERGNIIYVYTARELAAIEKSSREVKTVVYRLYYTPAANAATLVKPALSPESQLAVTAASDVGITSDNKTGGNNYAIEDALVVTDYVENQRAVERILKEVDRRPQQILVEATILSAALNETNSLGIDFTALGGVDFSSLSSLTGNAASATSGVQQALSGDILSNSSAAKIADHGYVGGSVGGGGLHVGVVKNNVALFLNALEGITDTTVLANPKVLVLNKQRGEVQVGQEQGYQTSIITTTTTTNDVRFLETGTHLIFRPFVGDNGYIRLEVQPEDSNGSVNSQGLPNKAVTTITTNVMVKDGHTIVIGGLFRESTNRTRSQVPGLGSLPFIGAAFRQQTDVTARQEVIILLTPHLIKDDEAYSAASEQEMKNGERVRVGMRRGLMPWGRERLAESWYEKAVQDMAKPVPDREGALYRLNCAINLNPQFLEAMQLREQITGREMTREDDGSVRNFIGNLIANERSSTGGPQTTPRSATRPARDRTTPVQP